MCSHTEPKLRSVWPALPWFLSKLVVPYVMAKRHSGYVVFEIFLNVLFIVNLFNAGIGNTLLTPLRSWFVGGFLIQCTSIHFLSGLWFPIYKWFVLWFSYIPDSISQILLCIVIIFGLVPLRPSDCLASFFSAEPQLRVADNSISLPKGDHLRRHWTSSSSSERNVWKNQTFSYQHLIGPIHNVHSICLK